MVDCGTQRDEQGFTNQDRTEYPHLISLPATKATLDHADWLCTHLPDALWIGGFDPADQMREAMRVHLAAMEAAHGDDLRLYVPIPHFHLHVHLRFQRDQEAMFCKLGLG